MNAKDGFKKSEDSKNAQKQYYNELFSAFLIFTDRNYVEPNFTCKEKNNEITCKAGRNEIVNGIFASESTFNISSKNGDLDIIQNHKIDRSNFIFEGYNLSSLLPQNVSCEDKTTLQKLDKKTKTFNESTFCKLDSNIYKIDFKIIVKHFDPALAKAKNSIDAINKSYESSKNGDSMLFEIDSIEFNINSVSLNEVLFDLYKREQRIANDENSMNNKDYLTKNDDILFEDYKAFLQGYYGVLKDLNTKSAPNHKSRADTNYRNLLSALIKIATTPNINVQIKITNINKTMIAKQDLQNISELSDNFLSIAYKILENMNIWIRIEY
ncbi:hypothetical protein [Helicobacter saguini]|uniref:Uncharacterized protein n=1 Tax=Helicobacter saguini TaxID=1548018 RepID=A0A6B0HKD4_9HELI|nr:hypothetical protein [Helicobacter saguini]MWV62638.1 hypothetical protein [Helicobacter saguini]MWV69040.1 hypothetical protein [Helicobacter saguini]MWV71406.1 hypothetical protein [Helicobacter saguini]